MESIMQTEKRCFYCGRTTNLECHHVFGGPNRQLSEQYGLKIWLCHEHHNEPPYGIHFNKTFRMVVQRMAQEDFERTYPRESFKRIFGKNYK